MALGLILSPCAILSMCTNFHACFLRKGHDSSIYTCLATLLLERYSHKRMLIVCVSFPLRLSTDCIPGAPVTEVFKLVDKNKILVKFNGHARNEP